MARALAALTFAALLLGLAADAAGQPPGVRHGEVVPRDVREMYERGMQYLAKTQTDKGEWTGGEQGPGVTALCLLVFLASGEDPNCGLYSNHIRRALRHIITSQNANTGYMGHSMYHHGFGMLGLAEAYGVVDERTLWPAEQKAGPRSIGAALELSVRAAITSQKKNAFGGWRYSPDATDADTTVSGAVLMGLLGARNAGVEVPDEVIDKAITYYTKMTAGNGQVGYSGGLGGMGGESLGRSSIAALVFAVARRKDLSQYKAAVGYLTQNLEQTPTQWPDYARYYQAQALFQADVDAWEKWNKLLVRKLKTLQKADGSFTGDLGPAVSTSLSLLALAVNFRFLPIYER